MWFLSKCSDYNFMDVHVIIQEKKEINREWYEREHWGTRTIFKWAACTVCYYPFDIFEYILEWSMKSAVMSSLWAITAAPFLWVFQRCLIASFLQLFRGGGSNLAGSLSPQNNTRHNGKDCAGKCCFFRIWAQSTVEVSCWGEIEVSSLLFGWLHREARCSHKSFSHATSSSEGFQGKEKEGVG